MNQQANVGSLEAVRQFRASFCGFGEQAGNAMGAIDMQIRRMFDWLEHEQVGYWTSEIRRREQQVAEARLDLMRARMASPSDNPSCTEQEVAWRRAKLRLEEAEEKLRRIKHWSLVLHQEVDDFLGQSQALRDHLEVDQPRAVALLERMLSTLEAYVQLAPSRASEALPSMSQGQPAPAPPMAQPQESRHASG